MFERKWPGHVQRAVSELAESERRKEPEVHDACGRELDS